MIPLDLGDVLKWLITRYCFTNCPHQAFKVLDSSLCYVYSCPHLSLPWTVEWPSLSCRKWKWKSLSRVPTLCDPMDYAVHGILQARILEWVAFPFSRGSSQTQGSNPGLLHCRQILYQVSHKGSPRILEWIAYPLSSGSSQPRNWTGVSCIACGFFTNWAMKEAQEPEGWVPTSKSNKTVIPNHPSLPNNHAFCFICK